MDEKKVARDVRLDHIGFVDELKKHFADDLRTTVKARLLGDSIDRAAGDFFDGLLVSGTIRKIDPEKLLKLFEKRTITRAQFLSAISVKVEPVEIFLSGIEIAKISTAMPANDQLRVTRKKGVEIALVNAVKGVGSAIEEMERGRLDRAVGAA